MEVQRKNLPINLDIIFQDVKPTWDTWEGGASDVNNISYMWDANMKNITFTIYLAELYCQCKDIVSCDCDWHYDELPYIIISFKKKQFLERQKQLSLF